MKFTSNDEARLLELLGEEQGIFERIRDLTGKQAALIAADDMESFNESLDSGQELIEKINGLHQETNALMQSYLSFSGAQGGAGAKSAKVEATLEMRRSVIAECADMNAKNLAAANEIAGEYSKRIEKLNLSRKSLGAYALGISNNSELFDTKT